jgi:DNA-directed RNA polymerase subunit RPC12/RpoP
MKMIVLVCSNCGGGLETTVRAELFQCPYCKYLYLVGYPAQGTSLPQVKKLVEREKWSANFARPTSGLAANWQGGKLYLTDQELVFAPHSINFGPVERVCLALENIVAVRLKTGLISDDISITDTKQEMWKYRVFKGKTVVEAILLQRDAHRHKR